MRLAVFAVSLVAMPAAAGADTPVRFGVDAKNVKRAGQLGMPVTYASVWAGAWNQKWGWKEVEANLRLAKEAGATPVVQWWYWGDDISPGCVENGCRDKYHGVWKDKATWHRLSNELADLIVRVMGPGSGAVIIPETEFNKQGIERHEAFDGYLAEKAGLFHARGFTVVLGFGNWGKAHWPRFDRAVAASDMIGAMALQSSVRDATTYLSGADMLINAARYNQATFGKPTFITDVGFSSYPAPSYELYQDTVVREIFARMGELRAAGVRALLWRMLVDDPSFDTANYHGTAERHWGLVRADGSAKPAFEPFVSGMRREADREALSVPAARPMRRAASRAAAARTE